MYRFLFRPRWLLFHLIVIAGIVGMIFLAFWQLDRLSERKDFNSAVRERSQEAPVELTVILDELDRGELSEDDAEWRRVTTSGTYLPAQIIEFNNSQGGRAGDNVLSALVTDDGTTVVVNRGFIPLGTDHPDAPTGEVDIIGFVRPSEVRERGDLTDADDGEPLTEIRRIDIPQIARQLPGEVAPVFIQLTGSEPPIAADDPEPVVLPELDSGPHLSYAIQWFIFAFCVALGWVLAVRRSLSVRAAERTAASTDSRSPVDDATENQPVETSSS
ncbi:SURF1 family cytochrome oxidase biogenesis protein [Ilumatobacter nonamiensis]|uniref:SURF1 family cytochrome oxidase biogenesis protein n=1 Tax=Ilumatobacter nonamiensis TaxID=467093 RepID=UPI000590F52D|nr:SURF1 family protein [Ilumatobacter nonamiensis]